MPYVNKPRPHKHEYELQKKRGEHEKRMERQRARRAFDKKHGKAARKGKDISHNKAFVNGGGNKDGYKLEAPSKNRARNYKKKTPKSK
jgi:hypothetical protein